MPVIVKVTLLVEQRWFKIKRIALWADLREI